MRQNAIFSELFSTGAITESMCVRVLSHSVPFVTPWTIVHQASLSLEFFRQEYWSGLPFPIPGDLIDPGLKPVFLASPVLAGASFTTVPPGKPMESISHSEFNQVSHSWMIGYVVRKIILWACAHGCNLLL